MLDSPTPAVGPQAVAAGRWLAHAERLFAAQREQFLVADVRATQTTVVSHPMDGPALTAHLRMQHDAAFHVPFLPTPARIAIDGFCMKVCLEQAIEDPQIDVAFRTAHGDKTLRPRERGWDSVCHALGLVCEAFQSQTVFHQALQWLVTGGASSWDSYILFDQFPYRMGAAAHTAMAGVDEATNTLGFSAPHLPHERDRGEVSRWMLDTYEATRVHAIGAFEAERRRLTQMQQG